MDNCCQLEVMFRFSRLYQGIHILLWGHLWIRDYWPVFASPDLYAFYSTVLGPTDIIHQIVPDHQRLHVRKAGGKNKEETLSFSLAISLFHQGCQLSPPAVPASYLSIISTWQIHFTMTSPSPYISFFLFFFLTSQLSSPLTGCLFLHKHEFAPLPTKMWFLKWILMVKKRQAWWREGKKKKPKATVTDPQTLSCIGL